MGDSQLWFDFPKYSESVNQENHTAAARSRPPDFPFEQAYNDPPDHSFSTILDKHIELNKNHAPTRRGWKTLYDVLSLYRSKRYETFRYLLLDGQGRIADYVALTNHLPNRVQALPDTLPYDEYFKNLADYASKHEYSIVLVHNHPTGTIKPSSNDKYITAYCMKAFKDTFSGHIILDHGSFGLYVSGKRWEMVRLKTAGHDPLVKHNRKAIFQYELNGKLSPDRVKLLQHALRLDRGDQWNTRDWVAVAFSSGWGSLKALHFYHTSEFLQKNAADSIVKKTVDIALRSGAVWAFPVTDNDAMARPIKAITRKTGVFRDFYVNGRTGNSLKIGGSVEQYFELPDTQVTSTMGMALDRKKADPIARPNPQVPAAAANHVSEPDYHVRKEKKTMQKSGIPEGDALPQKKHQALLEFLSRCAAMPDAQQCIALYNEMTGLRDFQFLKAYAVRAEESDWPRCQEKLRERYTREVRRYRKRFPDHPYPEASNRPFLLEEGGRVTCTPADFLEATVTVTTAGEYRALCAKFPLFDRGTVKAVSPLKIALFHEKAALPLILADNTPENWAKLYTKANDNGIAVNAVIPDPADVESLGLGLLKDAGEHWNNARSEQWQQEEFRKACARDRHSPDPATVLKDFYRHPYTEGTPVPPFLLQDEHGSTTYDGFSFKSLADGGLSVALTKISPQGNEETATVSAALYKTMIANAGITLNKPQTTPEIRYTYDRMMARDAEETRPNTASDFWHNYKILCRRQASNPPEAMEVAKAIVSQMPPGEREKFKRNIKAYEKATRKLSGNPLLRPFVKPQETYNQRILNYYEENVKNLPIKNTSANGQGALSVRRHGVTSRDVPGQAIDPTLRLTIGDTVKLSLDCKTLFGQRRKRLPVTAFTVVSASEDLNKIVLLDKTGNSKYTLAKDTFVEKMRKLERKLEKRQHKRDRSESIRY